MGLNRYASARTIIEQAGYRRERLPGGILTLRLLDGRKETIAAWHEDCTKIMSAWRPDQRLRYLHNIRHAERVTPFATERVIAVLRRMRALPVTDGKGAIVLTNPTLAALLGSFFKRRSYGNWQIQFFRTEDDALHWLAE